jgi:hypothetical protein
MDQLSPQACALSLLLVTVAAAQGLSDSADPSLCQRLSLTSAELPQARHALITLGLVAYERPLYQVLALDAGPSGAPLSTSPEAADDDPVDIKAVFARLWEVVACSTLTVSARSHISLRPKGCMSRRSPVN